VTNHDALGYFADRYSFEILDTVIPGGATLAEPSSADIVRLVETVEASGVPAIFSDEAAPDDLARLVASETATDLQVVPLFSGSLGEEGSGAESYVAMMRTNAERIAGALGPAG
jgi:zinc/manganese transport system substrate-binding protein